MGASGGIFTASTSQRRYGEQYHSNRVAGRKTLAHGEFTGRLRCRGIFVSPVSTGPSSRDPRGEENRENGANPLRGRRCDRPCSRTIQATVVPLTPTPLPQRGGEGLG